MSNPDATPARSPSAEMLSYAEAATFLGLCVGTLYSMVHCQRIPHVRLGPRLVRFSKTDLGSWLATNAVAARGAK